LSQLPKPADRFPTALPHDVVVIGASAGGIPALISLLSALPANFRLPILVVQHLSAEAPNYLPRVIGRRTALAVKWAGHGEPMLPRTVYVAPPNQHLLVGPGCRITLSSAARSDYWRPSVDLLFTSAAEICGSGVIAIVLSGRMWDGAKGIDAVARRGGITIVQDEMTSSHFDMPAAALDLGRADVVMNPLRIAEALCVLTDPAR
jgi:two-component system, chemotaxis family, protein-glutamate methylesterase/glutaminase